MAGDDLKGEVAKVSGLDKDLKAAETRNDAIGAKIAETGLQDEVHAINLMAQHDPHYAGKFMSALKKVDPHPSVHLDHAGHHLEVTPLPAALTKSGARADAVDRDADIYTPPTPEQSDAINVDGKAGRSDIALSMKLERDLLRGGKDRLDDTIAKYVGKDPNS